MLIILTGSKEPFNKIIDNLYLGDIGSRDDTKFPAIVSLVTQSQLRFCGMSTFPNHTTNVLWIPIYDNELGIGPYLSEGIEFIDKNRKNGNVLVHCMAGVSRSPSMVIAYLMSLPQHSFESAMKLVKSKRPCISPYDGFLTEIKQYFNPYFNGTKDQS